MLNIMIVEDEELIREGLSQSIQEEDKDQLFSVVCLAEDGEEALLAAQNYQPDIIITDIKMPFMDGITLLEKIKPLYPDTYVIILSGHDEFEYARRALKAGAYDYLLKPIQIKYLMEVLYNIKMEIDHKQAKEMELRNLKKIEQYSKKQKKYRLLSRYIIGKEKYDPTNKQMAEIFQESAQESHAVLIVSVENLALLTIGYDYLQLIEKDLRFENLVKSIISGEPSVMLIKERLCECILYVHAEQEEALQHKIEALRQQLRNHSMEDMRLCISSGKLYKDPLKLHTSYLEASRAREKGPLDFDEFVTNIDGTSLSSSGIEYMDFDDTTLLSAVRVGNKQQIKQELARLCEQMNEQKMISRLHMIMVAARIYFDVGKLLAEVSYNTQEALINNLEHFNQIISQNTPSGIAEKLNAYCNHIADFLEEVHSGKFAKVLCRAKDFIQNNFMNENLMLEDVAQHAFISSSYLCIIFKKEAGETFIEYLTRVRMEHAAKLLLTSDMRNYEIAEECGYSNPAYFSTIFKKYYNMPPSIYKSQHKKNM